MRRKSGLGVALAVAALACHGTTTSTGSGGTGGASASTSTTWTGVGGAGSVAVYGDVHAGDYHLGPVDFAESVWTNSCGPYAAEVQAVEGVMLAGVDLSFNGDGSLCDACALLTTNMGRQALVRIVTTGVSNAAGDMDVSQQVYDAVYLDDPSATPEHPRPMTWQLAACPATGTLQYQWQTGANEWWTSLWVRNARVPIASVSVMSANHATWTALERGTDGTLTDPSGFGAGAFQLRIVAIDGQEIVDAFDGFTPGALVTSSKQFE